jgi:hypothetical protein
VELIRQHMRPTPTFGKNAVYTGEISKPENEDSKEKIIKWCDWAMGVVFAMDLPWVVHWEFYGNELRDGTKEDLRPRSAKEMRCFWGVLPDGTLRHSGEYLSGLMRYAGKRLPESMRQR